jgi:hypothetical protein
MVKTTAEPVHEDMSGQTCQPIGTYVVRLRPFLFLLGRQSHVYSTWLYNFYVANEVIGRIGYF